MCVQFVGFTLTTSSENAIVGLDYNFTCVTTERYIVFTRDKDTICIITGGKSNGTCAFIGEYIANYTYTCNLATYTYTVAIPGSYLTDSLHGTTWQCKDRFGGPPSNTTLLYVNGELFFFFFFVITALYMVFCIRRVNQNTHNLELSACLY